MTKSSQQIDMALTIGQLLKNARERANQSVDDVADHLRLSRDVVRKIEGDAFEGKEMTVFIRGYIRSYAKYLKVPLDQIEEYFLSLGLTQRQRTVIPATFDIQKPSLKKKRSLRWVSLAVLVLVIVLVLSWSFSQDDNSSGTISAPITSANTSMATPVNTTTNKAQ